ncbi:hypothetical protein [Deinococcus wulumuqiensis]|uniref:PadR family transcriptional regulator n=1 Tax=Deinococcus wulumuqiensis TaxID=980427 RepID=A0AAV4K6Z5_9DEIO|nr:hypothetical protein GCM10010914_23100 [Deinococcus wulumuqiensis]GGP30317.1 hypothetical protein GCM10008021_19680 [Deinococcus wulumuqiensis]
MLAFLLQYPCTQGSDVYPLLRQLAERGLLLAEVQAFGLGRTYPLRGQWLRVAGFHQSRHCSD